MQQHIVAVAGTWGELLGEARVGTPEETDVWDIKQHHGKAFEAKPVQKQWQSTLV